MDGMKSSGRTKNPKCKRSEGQEEEDICHGTTRLRTLGGEPLARIMDDGCSSDMQTNTIRIGVTSNETLGDRHQATLGGDNFHNGHPHGGVVDNEEGGDEAWNQTQNVQHWYADEPMYDAHFHLDRMNDQRGLEKFSMEGINLWGGAVNFCDPENYPTIEELEELKSRHPHLQICLGIHPRKLNKYKRTGAVIKKAKQ